VRVGKAVGLINVKAVCVKQEQLRLSLRNAASLLLCGSAVNVSSIHRSAAEIREFSRRNKTSSATIDKYTSSCPVRNKCHQISADFSLHRFILPIGRHSRNHRSISFGRWPFISEFPALKTILL